MGIWWVPTEYHMGLMRKKERKAQSCGHLKPTDKSFTEIQTAPSALALRSLISAKHLSWGFTIHFLAEDNWRELAHYCK